MRPTLYAMLSTAGAFKAVAPGARRLVLVRHGAVDRNGVDPPVRADAFYGGNFDVPLSATGKAEALGAANLIAEQHGGAIKAIWSSPMRRALFGARATGTAIAAALEEWAPPMDVQTFDAFKEIDRGLWANLTPDEIEADPRWGEGAILRCARAKEWGPDENGGEGFCAVRERVLRQRDALLETLPAGGTAVIVSHMWVTRAMVGEALGEADPTNVDIPTASVSVVDYPEGFTAAGFAAGTCAAPTALAVGVKPPVHSGDEELVG